MNQSAIPARATWDISEQVETLLIELSARFISLGPELVDRAIQDAQRKICESLGFDRSSLLEQPAANPAAFLLTHVYQRPDMPPPPPGKPDLAPLFPWILEQLRLGKLVVISKLDDLPAEAARDRESLRRYGTNSLVVVPLPIGSGMIGALTFASARERGNWPEKLVKRLQLVAEVFANAIARARSDQALRESEARLQLTADSAGAGLWVLSVENGQVWASARLRELFQFAPEEELDYERFINAIHSKDREVVRQAVQQALQTRGPLRVEYRIVLPDGSLRWIAARGSSPSDPSAEPDHLMGVSVDVTERKQAEEALAESQARIVAVVENTNDLIWSVDPERFGILTFNTALATYFSKNHGIELRLGMTPDDLLPPGFALQWRDFYARALSEGSFVTEYVTASGVNILLLSVNRLERNGELFGISVFGKDITDRKRVEEALRQRNQYIETILEQAPIGFAVYTIDDGVVRFISARFEEIYRVPRGTITSYDNFFKEVFAHDPVFQEQIRRRVAADLASGDPSRLRFENIPVVLASGETRYITAVKIPLVEQNLMVSTVQDVTDRVRAETELRRSLDEVQRLRDQLQQQNIYLQQEVKLLQGHARLVGPSRALKRVLAQVEQVASTGSTVLLLGETGTGKELVASAIHELSPRREHPMVCVNCSAIPASLIESELFGREKGAYTGAMSKQVGRFELANGSTLFLDEIGDLSSDVQVKLLRVLQERQIERLGSSKTIPVNVRIIVATNHDLEKAVREGRFREDLYYRLNVFPITVPPLRERREDIPALVSTFVAEFSTALGKNIASIARESMDALQRYRWPGNVRELRNIIERAMIVAKGPRLRIEPPGKAAALSTPGLSMKEVDREHIQSVLETTGWRIRGKTGAAAILGLKPTTLETRMAKLGIHRPPKNRTE